jgi:putative resolvase
MESKYVGKKIALSRLGISAMTLLKLSDEKQIEVIKTTGGHRKYNVDKYITDNKQKVVVDNKPDIDNDKFNICYVRVSTTSQKDDLKRQRNYMEKKYPEYTIIEDIGSGINFNRKGFRKIIDLAIEGKINTLVVAFKDRLTRFGYELIEDLIKKYSNGTIIIENEKDQKKEPREELVDDVMQILNVYTAKMNGLRKYGKI